jgi:hypothetical protein
VKFGWDISTSIIGFAAFDSSGIFIESRYCDLRKFKIDLITKADVALKFVKRVNDDFELTSKPKVQHHFVEDRLKSFSFGRTSKETLLKLTAFNALVSWMIWRECMGGDAAHGKISHMHPSTVKAAMKRLGLVIPKGSDQKKQLTLDFVRTREKGFAPFLNKNGKDQPWCYDQADAYIIALAGMSKL